MLRRPSRLTTLAATLIVVASLIVSNEQPSARRRLAPVFEFGNGLELEVHGLVSPAPGGTVVLALHGCCGDRRDLAPLGRALAGTGATVAVPDVRPFRGGGGWPATYIDAMCAYSWTRRVADEAGASVAVIGWGDGALVAATIALGWPELAPTATGCLTEPPAAGPELVLGLSGHYGWIGEPPLVTAALIDWFGAGPEQDPTAWRWGNPGWWLDHTSVRPSFMLIGGTDDVASDEFAAALTNRGFDAVHTRIEDTDGLNIIQPRAGPGSSAFDAIIGALDAAAH